MAGKIKSRECSWRETRIFQAFLLPKVGEITAYLWADKDSVEREIDPAGQRKLEGTVSLSVESRGDQGARGST